MTCSAVVLNGTTLDCGNVGGLKEVYLADILDVTGITVSGGTVTAIAMSSTKKFKKFEFRKNNANFTSTSTRSDENGTNFVDTTLSVNFNHMETAKRREMVSLSKANTYAIAKDNNGKYWLIGYNSYCTGTASANSGATMGDANNYVLTITSQTDELPIEVVSAAITAIV